MKDVSIVDVLIQNIKADQLLLKTLDAKIEQTKGEKREIVDRLKDYRKDTSVLLKYADDERRKQLEELGFDFSESERGLNPVASVVLDIIVRTTGNKMTNAELFDAYAKTFKNKEDAYSYTKFNIKCRSLFNTQRLLRAKGKDPKSSRDDIISLNGRIKTNKNESKV
ncbi:hypothetical protein N9954_08750 [Maribacter sp.]|nr:hypothetical protein [Maribacter sp.]